MNEVRRTIERSLEPGRFFVHGEGDVRFVHRQRQEVPWEIFRGHLLDESRTRQRRAFEAWDLYADVTAAPPKAPLVSVKLADDEKKLYVVRYLLLLGWEAYESSPGVIESRPAEKETPELVGTIDLAAPAASADFQAELREYVFLAVVGTSRLPITSLESPLPAFSLGQLLYCPTGSGAREPERDPFALIRAAASDAALPKRAKFLDGALRWIEAVDLPRVADLLMAAWPDRRQASREVPALLRTVFNDAALSPNTAFIERLVALLRELTAPQCLGPPPVIDIGSYMLRHLARHLTAYDLAVFHNRGANYPDALLLDALLKAYLQWIERWPDAFTAASSDGQHSARLKRLRRRALRQACLLRATYEGLRVPDAPTSPGENQRVLPEPYGRVPDEQIVRPDQRRRRLYRDEPLSSLLTPQARMVLGESISDFSHADELVELGMAVYLDRPLGIFKEPGQLDRTPLLSYEAFSRRIADRRLDELQAHGLLEDESRLRGLRQDLTTLSLVGYPAAELPGEQRPGVVALEDARQTADDFLFLRTSRRSLNEFLSQCDWGPLESVAPDVVGWLRTDPSVLLIRSAGWEAALSGEPFLTAYDRRMSPRVALGLARASWTAYQESFGVEYPEDGFRVTGVRHADGSRVEPTGCEILPFPSQAG